MIKVVKRFEKKKFKYIYIYVKVRILWYLNTLKLANKGQLRGKVGWGKLEAKKEERRRKKKERKEERRRKRCCLVLPRETSR